MTLSMTIKNYCKSKLFGNSMPQYAIDFLLEFHDKWSVGLFSSSLMLASFLFTMKSFAIQTLKVNIYDKESNFDRVRQRRKSGRATDYYGGLRQLALLLKWTIFLALSNAMSQLFLSGFKSEWISLFCLLLSIVTITLFICVVWIVSNNIKDMIDDSEKKAVEAER
jgi:hypothetical protein